MSKKALREELEARVNEFIASGGKVEVLEEGRAKGIPKVIVQNRQSVFSQGRKQVSNPRSFAL